LSEQRGSICNSRKDASTLITTPSLSLSLSLNCRREEIEKSIRKLEAMVLILLEADEMRKDGRSRIRTWVAS
jgi:hypothetical protein